MTLDTVFVYILVVIFLVVLAYMVRGFLKYGGFRGMCFGARIGQTVGEVEGARRPLMSTVLKVHILDAAPEKAIGLEIVAKSFAAYHMVPFAMSVAEARKLITHLQSATEGR